MNRRNTIIIAILVNAGLLLVLFATAMRSGDKKEETSVKLAEAPAPVKEASSTPVTTEELLNEYIAAAVPSEEEVIVIDDLVNGTTVLETSQAPAVAINESASQPTSSLPGIAPTQATAPVATSTPATQATPALPKAAKASPVAPVTAPVATSEVTVKKGDYLEKIAKANGTTVDAIMQTNHLSSTNLKIGQVLKMPGKAKSSESPTPAQAVKDFYIVKEGDSPWLIASKCNVKLDELLRINNIDEQKAKKLRPGDKLRIR